MLVNIEILLINAADKLVIYNSPHIHTYINEYIHFRSVAEI